MDCASEEGEIRHAVVNIPGVRSLQFQLAARTLSIDAEAESLPLVLAAIRKAGFKPAPLSSNTSETGPHSHDHGHEERGHARTSPHGASQA